MNTIKAWINEQRRDLKLLLGKNVSLHTTDRAVLEQTIIPYFVAKSDCRRVLFVGCEWYTEYYERLFAGKEYWTIEIDPKLKKYGARNHIVDGLQNLDAHFPPNTFDLIIYNGVFGFGINTVPDADQSFVQCFQALRAGGVLVFGWNNTPEINSFDPEICSNWQLFQPYYFPPLATARYQVPDSHKNHTFCFLTR